MARTPVREVSGPSAIQGVAAPVNTYVRPADPAPSSLHQLAEGLAAFDSGLGSLLDKRKEKAKDADKQRAIRDAYSGASAGFDEGVKRGLIPPQESPTYMEWYKKTQGDMRGRQIADEFTLAHQQWEGRNGGDPEAFKSFVQDFIKQRVGDISDPQVLAGLNPHIESIYQNGYSVFTQERGEAVKKGALATAGSVTMDTIDRAEQDGKASGGIDYEGLWGAINAQRDEVLKRHTEAEADEMFVDSILLQAEESGNEELLDLLDRKWAGKDYAISSDPKVREKVMASRDRIMSAQASKATHVREEEERQEKIRHNTTVAEELRKMAEDPNYQIPEETLKVLGRRDPEFRTKLAGYRKQMTDKSIPEDDAALLQVYAEIDRGSSKEFVHSMVEKGVIRDPNTLIRALDRVEQVQKANAQGGIFDSPTYKDVVKRITNATGTGPLGLWGERGLDDDGLQALMDYRTALLTWEKANPEDALDFVKREKASLEIGQAVLGRVAPDDEGGGLYKPTPPSQSQSGPSGTPGTTPPARIESPQSPGPQYRSETEKVGIEDLAAKYGVTVEQAHKLLLEEEQAEGTQQAPHEVPPAVPSDGDSESIGVDLPGSGAGPMETFWNWITGERPSEPSGPPDVRGSVDEETRTRLTTLLQNPPMLADGSSTAGNTPVAPLLDLIGNTEGTDRRNGYNETLGYGKFTGGDAQLTGMTLDQIDQLQTQMLSHPDNSWNSSALGRYQIIRTTMRGLRKELGLSGDELFDEAMQDRLAMHLLERRGLSQWRAGSLSDEQFMQGLSAEWASLPKADGKGTYQGQRVGVSSQGLRGVLGKVRTGEGVQVASLDPSAGFPQDIPQAYAKIPATDDRGEDQIAKFMEWNPDPIGNHEENLGKLQPTMQSVIRRAQEIGGVRFVIGSGVRDENQQKKAVEWGWSKTEDSDHLDGSSVDLWPLDKDGSVVFDKKQQTLIVKAMKQAAKEMGVKLDIGADWKGFRDAPHFALKL